MDNPLVMIVLPANTVKLILKYLEGANHQDRTVRHYKQHELEMITTAAGAMKRQILRTQRKSKQVSANYFADATIERKIRNAK